MNRLTLAGPRTAAICAGLLVLYAGLAWWAVQSKCATFDEPLHAASAYVSRFQNDYRIDPEDPPLWKYWAMIPHREADLYVERHGAGWDWAVLEPRNQSLWAQFILYQTTTIDGAAFIERSRAMFLVVAVVLGAAMALWAYRLYGAVAAIVATVLLALDPTFLAHGPLVKNDVSITLILLLFIIALHQIGRGITWKNVGALGLLLGAGLTVKFTGVLLAPMMMAALVVRAAMASPWPAAGRELRTRGQKTIAAAGLLIVAPLIAWATIWASYRFRFDAGPNHERIDTAKILQTIAQNRFYLHTNAAPKPGEEAGWEMSPVVRVALVAEKYHLLPQAWIGGFLFTYSSTLLRPAFLMGRIYETGCWYYFPLTMLFKMPLATLVAIGLAALWMIRRLLRRRPSADLWRATCIAVPIVMYGASAISSNLNLGIRHLLPIMPFIFIAIGALAQRSRQVRPKWLAWGGTILALALAIETFAAFPDFLPFFNAAAGGKKGGLKLLADSNLDWGQDLPAVVLWQQSHPATPIYLLYFGRVSADFYDIQRVTTLDQPCVMAISATTLQGIYLPPGKKEIFRPLWDVKPLDVLNGTIYLYRFPEGMPSPDVADAIRRLVRDSQASPALNRTPVK